MRRPAALKTSVMAAVERRQSIGSLHSWPVKRSSGGLLGLSAAVALLLVGLVVLIWSVRQPVGLAMLLAPGGAVVAIGAAAGLAVSALGYFRLSYEFRPGKLLIRWGGPTET